MSPSMDAAIPSVACTEQAPPSLQTFALAVPSARITLPQIFTENFPSHPSGARAVSLLNEHLPVRALLPSLFLTRLGLNDFIPSLH